MDAARLDVALSPAPSPVRGGPDWRFLLPLSRQSRLLVVEEPQHADAAICRSLHALRVRTTAWGPAAIAAVAQAPVNQRFDIIAAPLGFGGIGPAEDLRRYRDLHRCARRLLAPGGTLLIGFGNRWGFGVAAAAGNGVACSTPREMTAILRGHGYDKVRLFGTLPGMLDPGYIFPLRAQTLRCALRQYYRHNRIGAFLTRPRAVTRLLLDLLPGYYAVASAPQR